MQAGEISERRGASCPVANNGRGFLSYNGVACSSRTSGRLVASSADQKRRKAISGSYGYEREVMMIQRLYPPSFVMKAARFIFIWLRCDFCKRGGNRGVVVCWVDPALVWLKDLHSLAC